MFFASEKEYEFLRDEVSEIRDCITKYIGYIISVAGLSSLVAKYFYSNQKIDSYSLIVIVISMIIITLLIEVIWYKFQSHNRHIGYIRLISQEIKHFNINEFTNEKKTEALKVIKKEEDKSIENLYAWEFVASRLDNARFHNIKDKVLSTADKIKFSFSLPPHLAKIEYDQKNIHREFFKKVISNLYITNDKEKKKKNLINKVFNICRTFFYAIYMIYFAQPHATDIVHQNIEVDHKYIASGWRYPRKIVQISFLVILLHILAIIIIISINYNFANIRTAAWHDIQWFPAIILFSALVILIFWSIRYVIGVFSLLEGQDSIEYYCWTFFIFRVQFLNYAGYAPEYFSRSFVRFFKSYTLINQINKDREIISNEDDKERCLVCKNKNSNNQTDIIICNNHLERYLEYLENCKRLPTEFSLFHDRFSQDVRNRLEK